MNVILRTIESTREELCASIAQHPFLTRCRNGSITLPELKCFLVQQGYYSRYFTRYLCALMSNLDSNDHVQALMENLCEELGLTSDSPTPHSTIYKSMLHRFGLSLENAPPPLPGTTALIQTMSDHCRAPNSAKGLGALCLGAEALVPSIYSDILTGFAAHGIGGADTEFFRIHVECDDGHADTLRDIMFATAAKDQEQLKVMIAAGRTLVKARAEFFSNIETLLWHEEAMLDPA